MPIERAANKSERLLQIEALLLAHPEGLSQSELARRLGVNRSTIHRDLPELTARFAVYETDDGRLCIDRDHYLADVRFTLHEALALHLAARLMAAGTDKQNPHAAAALRKLGIALEKLAPLISGHLKDSADVMDDAARYHDPVYLEVLETLTRAWSLGRKVELKHQVPELPVMTYIFASYFIEPYAVGQTAHVIGWREPPGALRTFKIERIKTVRLLDEPYTIPTGFDPQTLLRDAWGIWYTEAEPETVVLRFHPRVAARVQETHWHRSASTTPQADGYLLWEAQIAEPREMLPWIRGWGGDCEVLAPEGLREKLEREVRRMALLYEVGDVQPPFTYQQLWAKTDQSRKTEETHALIHHMIDVGQVTAALWDLALPEATRRYFSDKLAVSPEIARRWVAFAAALHDLGKASPVFQTLHPPSRHLLERQGLTFPEVRVKQRSPHGVITTRALKELLPQLLGWDRYMSEQLAHAVGGHHGSFFSPQNVNEIGPDRRGGEDWDGVRRALLEALLERFDVKGLAPWPAVLLDDPPFWTLLAGLVSFADWIGSIERYFFRLDAPDIEAYTTKSYERAVEALQQLGWANFAPPEQAAGFEELFPFPPRPLQVAAIDLAPKLAPPALVIVEAPTGEGKTEAALYLADRWLQAQQQRGTYVAMPTQATSNQMLRRFRDFLERRYTGGQVALLLLHGNAALSAEMDELRLAAVNQDEPEKQSTVVAHDWFVTNKKRSLLAPFAVGTVDQALLSILQTRHFFVRLFGLSHKTVIFDEVHAYDTYMSQLFQHLLRWLARMDTNVILLSATLPNGTRADLIEAYTGRKSDVEPVYPGIYWADQEAEDSVSFETSATSARTLALEWIERAEFAVIEKVRESVGPGGCVAVICNTVARAQSLYDALREAQLVPDEDLILFHARFPFSHRKAIEEEVLARFDKTGAQRPERAIVVATQVIEQSLDLDFDAMISDLAPVDLLLQRAGRLHRHARATRPEHLATPTLVLTRPELKEEVPQWGNDRYVYEPYVLLRSLLALRGQEVISVPGDVPHLIAEVYDCEDAPEDIPPLVSEALEKNRQAMEQAMDKDAYKARRNLISWPHDVDGLLASNFQLDEDNPELHEAWRALTRLTPPSVTLVCLHRQPDGRTTLDRAGRHGVDLSVEPNRDTIKALSQETVNVSSRPVVKHFLALAPPPGWESRAGLRYYRAAIFENGHCPLEDGTMLILDERKGLLLEKA